MKYSVVIPTYNVEKYIKECLESIFMVLDDYEIIIVDDGSVDNTINVIEEVIYGRNNVTFIKVNHLGVSAARNIALEKCVGQYVLFVDSDDILENNYYEIIEKLVSDKYDIIHFNSVNFNEQKVWKNKTQLEFDGSGKDYINKALLQDKYSTAIWMNVYSLKFLNENNIRFIEGIYHEDEEFNFNCLLHAKSIYATNEYLYRYRIHPTSITQNVLYKEERTRCKFFIYDRYLSLMQDTNETVYKTLCTYYSLMLLLEISKYPLGQKEFKILAKEYKKRNAIEMINSDIYLYKIMKYMFKFNDKLVYLILKILKKIKY